MKTVLVVDDERALAEAIAAVLSDEGYAVVQAPNGVEALAHLQEHAPDAIVLDFMMPLLNGAGVLRNLRDRPSAPPVILMTAASESEALREAAGHVAFLRKPFSADALLEAVAAVIGPPK